jgi:hypothetical protein
MHGAIRAVQLGVGSLNQDLPSLGHGVAGIDREIHNDLLHLAGVRADGAEILRPADDQLDVLADKAGQQPAHFFHDVIQVHDVGLQNLQTAESQELAG